MPGRLLLLAESNGVSELALLVVGLLVELDALGSVLEASTEWHQDAVAIRARMLRILTFQTKENKVLCRLVIMTEVSDSQLNISCSGSRK